MKASRYWRRAGQNAARSVQRWQLAKTARSLLPGIVAGLALILLILAGYSQDWTGFSAQVDTEGHIYPAKTLWDWITIVTIPIVLGLGAFWFSRAERETEQAIASDRLQEETLQNYLDRMAELLLKEGLRTSAPSSQVRELARARTLTVLRTLDHTRTEILLDFLYEAELIKTDAGSEDPAIISLRGADLTEIQLPGAYLNRADLSGADLTGADLHGAELYGANLTEANLSGANLGGANLREAKLNRTNLNRGNLNGADLSRTDLSRANLSQANLIEADLSEARLTEADLGQARLNRANLYGAHLIEANLTQAGLFKANLCRADLSESNLHGADLRGGVDLTEANLSGANLHGAKLRGCNLRGAQLVGANLHGADLADVNLEQADLTDAKLEPGLDNGHAKDLDAVRQTAAHQDRVS